MHASGRAPATIYRSFPCRRESSKICNNTPGRAPGSHESALRPRERILRNKQQGGGHSLGQSAAELQGANLEKSATRGARSAEAPPEKRYGFRGASVLRARQRRSRRQAWKPPWDLWRASWRALLAGGSLGLEENIADDWKSAHCVEKCALRWKSAEKWRGLGFRV